MGNAKTVGMLTRSGLSGMVMSLTTLLMFTRLDGHKVWVNQDTVQTVQGAGQLGYSTGTLITMENGVMVVQEDVNQVVRSLNDQRRHTLSKTEPGEPDVGGCEARPQDGGRPGVSGGSVSPQ